MIFILHINDYIHLQITSFTSDYFKNGYKYKVLNIINNNNNNKNENIIIIEYDKEILNLKPKSL